MAVACLAALTACTSSAADQARPTLAEAAEVLQADAAEIIASEALANVGRLEATERGDQDRPCSTGEAQRFFRAHGNFARPDWETPATAISTLQSALRLSADYRKVIDDLDIRDDDLAVAALRNDKAAVTFIIAARTAKPNILLVGKTDCLRR